MAPIKDMTGLTFNYLTVIGKAEKPEGSKCREAFWLCQCKCGNKIVSRGSNLRNGNTKSCGCYQKEVTSKMRFKDLSGQKFGKLTVIEPINRMSNEEHIIYKCQCECGNTTNVIGYNLTRGLTKSCGCNWHNSYGVQKIKELLEAFPLPYFVEVPENINNTNYYWDFVINPICQDSWIIEFDGQQHFKSGSESGWNTKENLIKTHKRDMIKNNFAFEKGIPLIRIPYTKENDIILEDLDPSTSRYLATKENIKEYYLNNGFYEE